MLKAIPEKPQAGKTTVINHLDTTMDINTETTDHIRPPCCSNCHGSEQPILGTLHLQNNTAAINVLIDTGCLQTNVVSARVAALLRQDGKILRKAGVQLVSGVGGVTYGVEGMVDATVSLKSMTLGIPRQICLRALVCNDVTTDLIIGLPSIQFFNLLPILQSYLDTRVCCEICPITESEKARSKAPHRDMAATGSVTERHTAAKDIPVQHSGYMGEMQTLFAEINSITDNGATPTYKNADDMIQALQGLL